jgi:RHS repeat-associated protein
MPVVNYDWDELEDNIVEEFDDAGNTLAEYTTEPDLFGNVISQNREGVESQFHFDALGSALAVTDDGQQVTDTRAYAAFGETAVSTGATALPFAYIGQWQYWHSNGRSQSIVRRRIYDGVRSRWLSQDPFADVALLSWMKPLFIHYTRYTYSINSPLGVFDPSGMASIVFTPQNTAGMQWSDDPAIPLPKVGETTCTFTLEGWCDICCDNKTYELILAGDITCEIKINAELAKRLEGAGIRDPKGNVYSLVGVYGHEQRHVENWRKFVGVLLHYLSEREKVFHCVDEALCKIGHGKEFNKLVVDIFTLAMALSSAHDKKLFPIPEEGVCYPPLNGVEMPPAQPKK